MKLKNKTGCGDEQDQQQYEVAVDGERVCDMSQQVDKSCHTDRF